MLTAVEFDPYSYEIHEDPFPVYRRLRDEAPAYYNAKRDFWALSRYDDVRAATNDWRTFTSSEGITIEPRRNGTEPHIIEMDPPRHTQLRALVSRAFTPARMARLEAPIRARTRALIATFAATGRVDLITDFAALLPMAVISEMLGVPDADQDRLRHAADALLHREPDSDELTPAGIEGAITLYGYFDGLIRDRQSRSGGDDLLSVLMAAEEAGHALTHSELLGFCFLLIIAGNETTTKLIGNAISLLAEHPDQRAQLRSDPTLVAGAVEETLRFEGSTQAMARCLTRDIEMHGQQMRAGTKVLLLYGSANRDERHWADAERFDLRRDTAGHLALGHGIHHCLGAALARLETRVALEELLPVLGDYAIENAQSRRVHSGNVRGFASLPLRFTP